MISNVNRIGRFTSSKIHVLLGTGSRPMTEEELKQDYLNPVSKRTSDAPPNDLDEYFKIPNTNKIILY